MRTFSLISNSKIKFIAGIILLGMVVNMKAQNGSIQMPKSYVAYQTIEAIIIDGKATERSWEKVQWTDDFIDIEGVVIPKYRTRAKMMWDTKYLYFYAELEEPHIWGDITEKDAVIFYNNDFEIFIDPDSDTHNYIEFEMNVLNTIWDLYLTKPYRNHGQVLDNWDISGLKSAVSIDGTLNDPSDIDKKWSIEIAMPWKDLNEASKLSKAPVGKTWRLGFSRVNWEFDLIDGKYQRKKDPKTRKYLPEYNWVWSPQGVINMHEPEKWGFVYFSAKPVGEKVNFEYEKDALLKLKMYEIYRLILANYKDEEVWNEDLIPKSINVSEKEALIQFELNAIGFTLVVESPFTKNTLILTQDGGLIIQK